MVLTGTNSTVFVHLEVYVQKSKYHMIKALVFPLVLLLCILKYLKWIYNTN